MRTVRAFVCAGVVAACVACNARTDLSAVSAYAKATAEAGTSFAAIAADYEQSCIRETLAANHLIDDTAQRTPLMLDDVGKAALMIGVRGTLHDGYAFTSSAEAPVPSPAADSLQADATASAEPCATEHEIANGWKHDDDTILAYVQALGALAGVDAAPAAAPSPAPSALVKAGVSDKQISAASTLVAAIAGYFATRDRERSIASFVDEVNPWMKDAITSLEVVDAAYANHLAAEYAVTLGEYTRFVNGELRRRALMTGDSESARARRLAIDEHLLHVKGAAVAAIAVINRHRQASIAYADAIAGILRTHEALYAASQRRATLKDYADAIEANGEPIVVDLQNLAKAVN